MMKAGRAEYTLIIGKIIRIKNIINFLGLSDWSRYISINSKRIERIKGGFNWLLGDCIAQKRDSPLRPCPRNRDTSQPKELFREFKNINNNPPLKDLVIFWPKRKLKYKNNTPVINGKSWKSQKEVFMKVIFER